MKTTQENSRRRIRLTAGVLILAVLAAPFSFAQSGSNTTIKPSVQPGGGGASANGGTRLEASIGQHTLGTSGDSRLTLSAGFWPNATACPLALSPMAYAFPVLGGADKVAITAAGDCNWTATPSDDWVNLISVDHGSGKGSVDFLVRENPTGSLRRAIITIGDFTAIIVQDGSPDCRYNIEPLLASFPAAGGTGRIRTTVSGPCAWQAASSDSWLVVTSGLVGLGSGIVTYWVSANTDGVDRVGTLTIAGNSFTVRQSRN